MPPESTDPQELMTLLAELGRLELDLLVRDQPAAEAVGLLLAMREEVEVILERAAAARRVARLGLAAHEQDLTAAWPGAGAVEPLRLLADGRRALAELDAALRPVQLLFDELVRRSSRRPQA